MSFPADNVEFCPVRTNVDWSNVQFSDYPNQELQVADYSNVKYFEPSDSDEEQGEDAKDGKSACLVLFIIVLAGVYWSVLTSTRRWRRCEGLESGKPC